MKNKFLFSVFVYFIILVLLSLGSWQLYRLNWKLNLISEIENSLKNDPVELLKSDKKNYLRIKTSGQIDFDKQIYLYNLNKSGKPGFEVINPILIGNENYLINRGWISFDQKDQSEINFVNEDKIIGTLKLQTKASTFKPENDIEKNYWFTLNRDDVFKYTGKNFSNFIIYLNGDYKTPEPKVITANISNNHKKYAITWFSMAISILLIYLYFRRKNY
ncbi:SURF1 family protein [Candidatus Pelagibacter sp.]|nr:SURF1 family protein [Candidatus Pelagibacter sp.]